MLSRFSNDIEKDPSSVLKCLSRFPALSSRGGISPDPRASLHARSFTSPEERLRMTPTRDKSKILAIERRCRVVFGDNLFCVVRECFRLRQQLKAFDHFRV